MGYRFVRTLAKLCTQFCLFLLIQPIFGQRYYSYSDNYADKAVLIEFGGGVGIINCLTDLGGGKGPGKKFTKDINWKNTQACGSMYVAADINDAFGLRVEASFGKVKAYDSILSKRKNESHGRYYRNLSFQSNISEVGIIGEIHPLLLKDYVNEEPPRFSPYLLFGIAKFRFNPQTYLRGQWIDLQPLHLEGQGFPEYKDRKEYRLTATSYPVGVGLRYELGSILYARLETVYRITNTDYLDDVSQERYVNPAVFARNLPPARAALANQLYSRSYEVLPGSRPDANSSRGYATNTDAYFSMSLKLGILLNRNRIR
jgi:hypothetical protein